MVILMNIHSKKLSIVKQKKMYLVFISMMLCSLIMGFFFYFIISNSNKELVMNTQKDFFNNISNINYFSSLMSSILTNGLYVLIMFILGLSVLGFIFIIGIILVKSFIVGFSISSIIGTFGWKGIVLSLVYVFPHQILFLIILLLMCFYGCNFCYRLFNHIFKKQIINFRGIREKYIKVFIISLIGAIICSLYEVFIIPYLIKIFI